MREIITISKASTRADLVASGDVGGSGRKQQAISEVGGRSGGSCQCRSVEAWMSSW